MHGDSAQNALNPLKFAIQAFKGFESWLKLKIKKTTHTTPLKPNRKSQPKPQIHAMDWLVPHSPVSIDVIPKSTDNSLIL